MESMAAYTTDLNRQVAAMEGFSGPPPLSKAELGNAIFTGSGDSLAAAMLAEALSGYAAQAVDPLELYRNPSMIGDRTLYIVSISGRTIANIRLAESHPSTAITANPQSRLARAASRTIHLDFPNSDTLTAGSISFLNSALACMSLVRPLRIGGAGAIFERARKDAAGTTIASGRLFFVGNQHSFPVAMYAAAKVYEILGLDAHYSRTEQFAHMELFSARPGDHVILLEDANPHARSLAKHLEAEGLSCTMADPGCDDPIQSILYHVFYAQHLPLNRTGDRREVHFMEAQGLKRASDSLIY